MDALFFIVWIVVLLAVVVSTLQQIRRKQNTISDDGHRIAKDKDITCNTKFHHNHPQERRYIVHEEPTDGYVILNGRKRKIEDCKYL